MALPNVRTIPSIPWRVWIVVDFALHITQIAEILDEIIHLDGAIAFEYWHGLLVTLQSLSMSHNNKLNNWVLTSKSKSKDSPLDKDVVDHWNKTPTL